MLPKTRTSPAERERNLEQELDTIRFGRAEAIVPYRHYKLRFILRAIPLITRPDYNQSVPSLTIVCPLAPRTGAQLFLRKAGVPFFGPTGVPLNPAAPMFPVNDQLYKAFLSEKQGRVLRLWPANTYFCPFENEVLKKGYTLRSTSVPLGQAFASREEIAESLEAISGLEFLYLSECGLLFGEEYAIVLSAQAEQDVDQFKLLRRLVVSFLDLLEEQEVITRE
jgi:hypothetical protein